MASDFYRYFKENMDALGLPAPNSLYSSALTAYQTARKYIAFVAKFGTKVTVAEMIGAGIAEERYLVLDTMAVSYYVGAVIGSIGIATQRCAMGGTSIADVLMVATKKGIHPPYLHSVLLRNPGIVPKARRGTARFSGPR